MHISAFEAESAPERGRDARKKKKKKEGPKPPSFASQLCQFFLAPQFYARCDARVERTPSLSVS